MAMLLVLMLVATEVAGFIFTSHHQRLLIELRNDTREMRIVQQALVDQKESAEDYVQHRDSKSLIAFSEAARTLASHRPTALQRLDRLAEADGSPAPSRAALALQAAWARAVAAASAGSGREAQNLLSRADTRRALRELRGDISRYLEIRNIVGSSYEERIRIGGNIVVALQVLGGLITVGFLALAFAKRRRAIEEAVAARQQVEILFEMTDTLQSASGYEDAHAVLSVTARRLLPQLSGSLYVFSNSRDRLDLVTHWGEVTADRAQTISPGSCWALMRGKPHVNVASGAMLRCQHHQHETATLEVPMVARGEVYGMLALSSDEPGAAETLKEAAKLASALADGMSLALSNLSLREKLRNQALRDPLTGLYNRRYMEDMLERFVRLAARQDTPVSVVMIDLDHFKRLNDEHGHLFGDAVLRGVANVITENLRETDVACRYGGEELVVLLPDCGLPAALHKAEEIRGRIEALAGVHGAAITASLGVAAVPETSSTVADLVRVADAALYQAKRNGRNRVVAATPAAPTMLAAE